MGPKEIFIGPCSKYIDGQGWTTEIPVEMLKEKGYVKAEELQKQLNELTERYLEESKERCEFEQKYKKIQHAHNIGLGTQRSQWKKKVEQERKQTVKEITSKVVDLNIICGGDFRLFLYNFELWVKERYGVEVE